MDMIDGPYQTYDGGATFIRRCGHCNRFVRANKTIHTSESWGLKDEPNAVCTKCGPTKMLFVGFY